MSSLLVLSPDLLPATPLGEMTRSDLTMSHLKFPGLTIEDACYPSLPEGPAIGYLCEKAAKHSHVLVMLYARDRLSDSVRELVRRLVETNPNTVIVSLSSPYVLRDVPQAPAYVLSYNYTPLSLQALGEVLTGQTPARGKLPVTLPALPLLSGETASPAYPAGHGWSA